MGAAAEHRGNRLISRQIEAEQRPVVFALMDELNAMPKYPDCGQVYAPVVIQYDSVHSCFWIMDAVKRERGWGWYYPSLRECLRRWAILLTEYNATTQIWTAIPWSSPNTKGQPHD